MASLNARQTRMQSSQGVTPFVTAHSTSRMQSSPVWVLASWNVRTLLDVDGRIETARKGVDDAEVVDEMKVDQVVGELSKYRVEIAAVQETKWFGNEVHEVGGSVVLASGWSVPGDGVVKQRGEGVVEQRGEGMAIVLSGSAVGAWKDAGKSWKAWSLRLVSVKLKVERGCRDKCLIYVFSGYAPTDAASREDKNAFYDLLQQALDSVPAHSSHVLLGDFTARVGSRDGNDDPWWYKRVHMGMESCMKLERSCCLS